MTPTRGLSSTLYSDPHPTAYLAAFAAVMATATARLYLPELSLIHI